MCLYPRLIRNPKYKENKKNMGIIPSCYDDRQKLVPIGCGNCMECSRQKANEWKIRLLEEIRVQPNKHFITLTFSEENLKSLRNEIPNITGYDLDNAVATLAVRRYMERWRKKHKISCRHWLVTEIGHNNTERIHIHGIMFTIHKQDINDIWQYGNTFVGSYVNESTVGYIIKYITKKDFDHSDYKPIILTSPGMGASYMQRRDVRNNAYNENGETKETYTARDGTKLALPIYYKNKIYTEKQREELWSKKLDKQERWVDRQKISTAKTIEQYINARNIARAKSQRLGYKNNITTEQDEKYKDQIREIKKIKPRKIVRPTGKSVLKEPGQSPGK